MNTTTAVDTQDPATMSPDMLQESARRTHSLIVSALYGDDFTDDELASFYQRKADVHAELATRGINCA